MRSWNVLHSVQAACFPYASSIRHFFRNRPGQTYLGILWEPQRKCRLTCTFNDRYLVCFWFFGFMNSKIFGRVVTDLLILTDISVPFFSLSLALSFSSYPGTRLCVFSILEPPNPFYFVKKPKIDGFWGFEFVIMLSQVGSSTVAEDKEERKKYFKSLNPSVQTTVRNLLWLLPISFM